ncbi:unnamed protein product [Macrosiphum euphorbiae]|uniref:Uncharacterized protein n=1 Tax=Macrosiphum euphorbiae TaxID=13131 RepID=A0AAV0VNW5_9HEMI|nr:unnamed protein product [Macrosiphum euphorbiae]
MLFLNDVLQVFSFNILKVHNKKLFMVLLFFDKNNINITNKLREIKLSINPWKTPSPSSRHEEVVTTRYRIGHSRPTHLHLITKEDRPTCELCDKELTIKHIILERPKFNSSRQIIGNPPTMQQALGEENSKNIYHFFTNIGLAKLM